MNKFTILLALFIFMGTSYSSAQDLKMEIYNTEGDQIENGAYLYKYGTILTKSIKTDSLIIKNISDETIKLKVRKIEDDVLGSTLNHFYALAALMEPGEYITPDYWELESGASLPLDGMFRGFYAPQNIIGTSKIIYSFLSVDDNDVVLDSVYVNFAYSNSSLTVYSEEDEALYSRELLINCDPSEISEIPFKIYNHTIAPVSCRIGKNLIQSEEGHSVYFKYGGVEYIDESSSAGEGLEIPAGETLMGEDGFVAVFNPNGIDGNELLTTVEYKFFNRTSGNDAIFLTLIYNPTGVGFAEMDTYQISNAYPNPAIEQFAIDYELPAFKTAKLKLYHINGALLKEYPINTTQGNIQVPVSDLSSGTYFYSIVIDGKPIGVDKVVVQ